MDISVSNLLQKLQYTVMTNIKNGVNALLKNATGNDNLVLVMCAFGIDAFEETQPR